MIFAPSRPRSSATYTRRTMTSGRRSIKTVGNVCVCLRQ
nr:MAG TPA_asm: hypothetical protein [Caudoviricetes sp.]